MVYNMRQLGIDASSTKAGFSVNIDGKIETVEVIFYDDKSLYEKYIILRNAIIKLYRDNNIEIIVIEDFLKQKGGQTTASTLYKLAQMNGLIYGILYSITTPDCVIAVHPSTARKKVIGMAFTSTQKTKDMVADFVQNILGIPIGRTKQNNLKKGEDDKCDAIILSLYT